MASREQLNGGRPQLPRHEYSLEALQRMTRAYLPGLFDFWDFEVTERTTELARHDNEEAATYEWLRALTPPDEEPRTM